MLDPALFTSSRSVLTGDHIDDQMTKVAARLSLPQQQVQRGFIGPHVISPEPFQPPQDGRASEQSVLSVPRKSSQGLTVSERFGLKIVEP